MKTTAYFRPFNSSTQPNIIITTLQHNIITLHYLQVIQRIQHHGVVLLHMVNLLEVEVSLSGFHRIQEQQFVLGGLVGPHAVYKTVQFGLYCDVM